MTGISRFLRLCLACTVLLAMTLPFGDSASAQKKKDGSGGAGQRNERTQTPMFGERAPKSKKGSPETPGGRPDKRPVAQEKKPPKKPTPDSRRCMTTFKKCERPCRNPFGKIAGKKSIACDEERNCTSNLNSCLDKALGR